MSADFAALGLEQVVPGQTYLDDFDEVWIGARWDIARRADQWHIYRKGNWRLSVGSADLAARIVADGLGVALTERDDIAARLAASEARLAEAERLLRDVVDPKSACWCEQCGIHHNPAAIEDVPKFLRAGDQ